MFIFQQECESKHTYIFRINIFSAKNTNNDQSNHISLSQVDSFYKNIFALSQAESQEIHNARDEVKEKYAAVRDTIHVYKDSCVPVCKLGEQIKQLSKNSSPDMDGVTAVSAEHLTHYIETDLINKLAVMFSLCILHGSSLTVFALVY